MRFRLKFLRSISLSKLILILSAFFVLSGNFTFYQKVLEVYPLTAKNLLFLTSLTLVMIALTNILLSLFCFKFNAKYILIPLLIMAASSAYFMDTYQIIVDDLMIDNIFKTDVGEATDLITWKLIFYLTILGIIPSILVIKTKIEPQTLKKFWISKSKFMGLSIVTIVLSLLLQGSFYASFFREHKTIRFYSNPSYFIYSFGKYISKFYQVESKPYTPIGLDAHQNKNNNRQRKVMVLVIGETVRADHFSLNGYNRTTTPRLNKLNVINFTNVWSCGTSTAISVPCMFSYLNHGNYDHAQALNTDNVLDILKRAGVNVFWLDNNSDSKGVADRVSYQSYKSAKTNPICNPECRDEGMLDAMEDLIKTSPPGDILLVLHQMGNHGPAYYKRYPKTFEHFKPTCKTSQLNKCSQQQITNAYDNAILYTDYFLAKTIDKLSALNNSFQQALFYISDHGESLGENNIYLHGLPYFIAPDTQKHVAMFLWFGDNFKINRANIIKQKNKKINHDYIFHTLLGIFNIDTQLHNKELDLVFPLDEN